MNIHVFYAIVLVSDVNPGERIALYKSASRLRCSLARSVNEETTSLLLFEVARCWFNGPKSQSFAQVVLYNLSCLLTKGYKKLA